MIFIYKDHVEKLKELHSQRKESFIKKAKEADPIFLFLCQQMKESPDFETYPPDQKMMVNDVLSALKNPDNLTPGLDSLTNKNKS